MCRLLGVAANKVVDLTFSLLQAPNSLRKQSRKNADGWGIAAFHDHWDVWKEAYSAGKSSEFVERSHQAAGSIIISHIRDATVGSKTIVNTHPFQHENWVLAHNGTVRNAEGLSIVNSFQPVGQTDSERIFCAILSNLKNHAVSMKDADSRAVSESVNLVFQRSLQIDPKCKLNLLFSNGSVLYVFRHGHPLFWLLRTSDGMRSMQSKTLEMLEKKVSPGEKAILVATEKLTDEDWKEVPSDLLLLANPKDLGKGLSQA